MNVMYSDANGNLATTKDLGVDNITVFDNSRFKKEVKMEENAIVDGSLSAGNITTGGALSAGSITTGGALSAGNISTAGMINANKINVHAGNPSAVPTGRMAAGSLTIGDVKKDYGGGKDWNDNTAGLLMECSEKTEIAIHDAGTRVASAMYYDGPSNTISIGRDMGWRSSNVNIPGNANVDGAVSVGGNIKSTGDLQVYRAGDTNKGITITANNADGAAYDNYNGGIASWNGLGVKCLLDNKTRHLFNTRNGDLSMKGSLQADGAINASGIINAGGSVTSSLGNAVAQFRAKHGSYGTMLRQDGANFYLLTTKKDDPDGSYSDKRPFYINNESGDVTMTHNVNIVGTLTPGKIYAKVDSSPDSNGIEFRHSNESQGIGFGYNTIYATGSNADQNLNLKSRGTGKVQILNNANVTGNIDVSGSLSAGNILTDGTLKIKGRDILAELDALKANAVLYDTPIQTLANDAAMGRDPTKFMPFGQCDQCVGGDYKFLLWPGNKNTVSFKFVKNFKPS
jgi:Phage T4 tail fibre